jgi:hypothetical protein
MSQSQELSDGVLSGFGSAPSLLLLTSPRMHGLLFFLRDRVDLRSLVATTPSGATSTSVRKICFTDPKGKRGIAKSQNIPHLCR